MIDLDRYDAVLCDLDGCLVAGGRVLPGAAELAARLGERLHIVSNNSTDTPATLSARLAHAGLAVPPERIVLAGTAAIDLVAGETPGAPVAVFGAEPVRAHALARGLKPGGDAPETCVLCRDTRFDYAALGRLVAMLGRGARLVVSNTDGSHPGLGGGAVPETGALLAAVAACLPGLAYRAVGKPEPLLFRQALAAADVRPEGAVLIGDNPETDGAGAARMGLAFVRVGHAPGTGLPTVADLVGCRAPAMPPRLGL